jgi:hypothetical protein
MKTAFRYLKAPIRGKLMLRLGGILALRFYMTKTAETKCQG